jgi:hypothetical protein
MQFTASPPAVARRKQSVAKRATGQWGVQARQRSKDSAEEQRTWLLLKVPTT